MRNRRRITHAIAVFLILTSAGLLLAQSNSGRPLFFNGKKSGSVVQFDGRSYVDLETVAQIMNGTVTIEPEQVLLTVAGPASAAAPPSPPSAPASAPGLSRDFARAAIAQLAEMREWRGAVGAILTYGVPVVGTWPEDYHDRAELDLQQVAATALTDDDQNVMQLLQYNFDHLTRWAADVVATRNALNATDTVRPTVRQDDPALAKISGCSRFLASMLVSGSFADDAICH